MIFSFFRKLNFKKMILNTLAFIGGMGAGELILIGLVILLLFGGRKLPELMRGLGKGIKEFKDAQKEITSEIQKGIDDKA
jgi:sec-independent protein translocase protein TatA